MSGAEGESLMQSIFNEVTVLKDRLKIKDEDELYNPFEGLQKSEVLQECKKFNDSKFVTQQPRRCCIIITQLLFLVHHGEVFTERETTEVFFGVTKLFQSKNAQLRRMMYLFIKHLAEITREEEVIIVVASLVKDMTSNDFLNKANSIRVLSRIVSGGLLGNIEKYVTQAIVAKEPMVASAALVAGLNWLPQNRDIVSRWGSQVAAAVSTPDDMVQYHALALLYETRKADLLAVSKIVTKFARNIPRSNLAACLLVQYTKTLMLSQSTTQQSILAACHDFLDSCMRHQSELLIYEAARAVCELQGLVPESRLKTAVTVLHMFLTSPKPTLRFAAVRCLNKVAMSAPQEVMKCNDDMELLIGDPNRSIATLAITTLLKTGSEGSIDRLMQQISTFMGEIGDEFKVVVVEAIQALCIKYPRKHPGLLAFLSNSLRDEGGASYKKAIVDATIHVMTMLPQCRDMALLHLCEFIEDCEFVDLSVSILALLGREVPRTAQPASYIRFIFNRVILEKPLVRAAAVTSLAKLGLAVAGLAVSIVPLLRRCIYDDDNEVRDRATAYIALLQQQTQTEAAEAGAAVAADDDLLSCYQRDAPFGGSVARLALSLQAYRLNPTDGPLTVAELPEVAEPVVPRGGGSGDGGDGGDGGADGTDGGSAALAAGGSGAGGGGAGGVSTAAAALYEVPAFAGFGALVRSCATQPLGEAESEYVVQCTKHIFNTHVVLQFDIRNTVDDQLLEDVRVECEVTEGAGMWNGAAPPVYVPAPAAPFGKTVVAYTAFERDTAAPVTAPSVLTTVLRFVVKEADPDDGTVASDAEGEDEEWDLEPLTVRPLDFMVAAEVAQFDQVWAALGEGGADAAAAHSARSKVELAVPDVAATLPGIIAASGMAPCQGTQMVADEGARAHMFLLSGVFAGQAKVLVRAQLVAGTEKDGGGGALKLIVRATEPHVPQLVVDALAGR